MYRKSAASEYTLIKENVSGIGYVDQTVIPGETYTYQIALSNSGGEGLRSEALEVQAPAYETLFEDTFDGDKISDQWKDASETSRLIPPPPTGHGYPEANGKNTM